MDTCFVDFQGFRGVNNEFILKEMAVLFNGYHQHFILTPPFHSNFLPSHLKRQAHWLREYHHGFTWDGGDTDFCKVKSYLRKKIKNVVYVKGREKKHWLQKLINNENVEVINLEDLNYKCPNLKELKRIYPDITLKCWYHGKICALQNVYLLSRYIKEAKNCN